MSFPPSRRSIFALVNEWAEWLGARGLSERTIDSYWRYLLAAGRLAGKDPREFSERDVVEVMSAYPAKGGGRAMAIRAMRSFFAWAVDVEVAEMLLNPARRITVPRSKLPPAPRLSRDELGAVWTAAEQIDPRARPTLVLLYFTGARVGSIVGVEPEHIRTDRLGGLSIYFAVAKGDFPYELPLEAPEAIEAVEELRGLLDWKPKMAVARRRTLVGVGEGTVWKWVSKAGALAGVRAYPHLVRHTMLSDLAQDPEVDVRTWVQVSNHRDGSQLRRYAAASEPRIRGALARLGASHPGDTVQT
jgi:integrase/recombinase XerD